MQAWNAASAMIAAATEASPEGVRDFLDIRHGRHFADDVAGELGKGLGLEEAIEAAIARWMGWRIDRRTNHASVSREPMEFVAPEPATVSASDVSRKNVEGNA